MSQNEPEREVACTLTEKQEAKRPDDVQATLIDHYIGYEEQDNGVVVHFDGTDA